MIGLTVLLFGGIWNTLGLWTRRADERFNWGLIGHTSRNMTDSVLKAIQIMTARLKRVQGRRLLVTDLTTMNVIIWLLSAFVQKKNLPEAKLKSFGLKTLTEEISRQLSIDCVAYLLVAMLIQT